MSYWLILIVLLNLPNLFQLPGLARMYARDGVVTLRESPSTISSLVSMLVLISRLPTNELWVAKNAQERIRIDNYSVTMSKTALGICYESSTIFRIGEFVAKFWTVQFFDPNFRGLRIARTDYGLYDSVIIKIFANWVRLSPRIQIFVNSWRFVGFGPCVE